MEIEVITKEKLTDYKHLMLSYIYEELDTYDDDLDCEYICLAAMVPNEDGIVIPVSVLICLMEPFGDIAILSIYTLPSYRRRGYASELVDKAVFIARRLFVFQDGEDEEDIDLKAIYRLRPEFKDVFEEFLKKNHFSDFVLLDEDDDPQVWAALAEYHFYKTKEELGDRAPDDDASPSEEAGDQDDMTPAEDAEDRDDTPPAEDAGAPEETGTSDPEN